jgi:hypothetical protein
MKKTLAVVALLAGAVSGYSQGQVNFGDYNTDFQVTVWSPQTGPNQSTVQLAGNSPANFGTGAGTEGLPDIPSGTQNGYTGVPLGGAATGAAVSTDYANGNLWSVQLYAAAGGSPASALTAVPSGLGTMNTTAAYQGLYTLAQIATIPGVAAGGSAELQLRAWYNGGGTIGSYELSVTANGVNGVSTIGTENIGGGTVQPPDLPGGVTGIQSFNVTATVPEPSTIALGIMGASAFLMRLRRRN